MRACEKFAKASVSTCAMTRQGTKHHGHQGDKDFGKGSKQDAGISNSAHLHRDKPNQGCRMVGQQHKVQDMEDCLNMTQIWVTYCPFKRTDREGGGPFHLAGDLVHPHPHTPWGAPGSTCQRLTLVEYKDSCHGMFTGAGNRRVQASHDAERASGSACQRLSHPGRGQEQ
eukprot:783171-Pelagomonas_calceolata.AAC.5